MRGYDITGFGPPYFTEKAYALRLGYYGQLAFNLNSAATAAYIVQPSLEISGRIAKELVRGGGLVKNTTKNVRLGRRPLGERIVLASVAPVMRRDCSTPSCLPAKNRSIDLRPTHSCSTHSVELPRLTSTHRRA
jgi:hypothetical protein